MGGTPIVKCKTAAGPFMLKLSLRQAEIEFGVSRDTLRKRLVAAGIEGDGGFTIQEICAAVYDDKHRETMRKLREGADAAALSNARERAAICDPADIAARLERKAVAWREFVAGIDMQEATKAKLLADTADLFVLDPTANHA